MNSFNFNSQICTSREQSESLLALGLKKETADCTLRKVSSKVYVIEAMPFCEYVDGIAEDYIGDSYIPAWVSLQLEDLANWIDDVEEFKEKPDLDNSEYDWGHNIKNYIDE